MIIGGGLGDEYMGAPKLNVEDKKGSGSFLALVLDALGIHRQVAKGPKEKKDGKGAVVPDDTNKGVNGTPKPMGRDASPSGQNKGDGGSPAFTPMIDGQGLGASLVPPNHTLTILDDATAAFQPFTPQASKFGLTLLPRTLR